MVAPDVPPSERQRSTGRAEVPAPETHVHTINREMTPEQGGSPVQDPHHPLTLLRDPLLSTISYPQRLPLLSATFLMGRRRKCHFPK